MAWRLRHLGNEEQGRAVAALQRQVWLQVVARFDGLRGEVGLRQSDLAHALGVSRPQIHQWLSDPANMTIKAAGRLLLAMDGELNCKLASSRDDAAPPKAQGACVARVVLLLAGLAALLVSGDPAIASPKPAVTLKSLNHPETTRRLDGPAVALFWKADCGPCLLELRGLTALRAAAAPVRVYTVALDPPSLARERLSRLGVDESEALVAMEKPPAVLAAYSAGAPRLPLAVAISRGGAICARHVGLLGTDRVRAWARTC